MNTTTIAAIFAALLPSAAPQNAEAPRPTSPALERAIVVEELEHDRAAAREAYARIAADTTLADGLRRRAWFRFGRASMELGLLDEGRAALEKAAAVPDAVGADAAKLLQDPDRGAERKREIGERARILANQFVGSREEEERRMQDLIWLGPDAVPGIIEVLTKQWPDRPDLFRAVWQIGGAHAVDFLRSVCRSEDWELRMAAAQRTGFAETPGMVAAAEAFLADADLDIVLAVAGSDGRDLRRYSVDALLTLIDRPEREAKRVLYKGLATSWSKCRHVGGAAATARRLAVPIARDLAVVDSVLNRDAAHLLLQVGLSCRETIELLVRYFERVGRIGELDDTVTPDPKQFAPAVLSKELGELFERYRSAAMGIPKRNLIRMIDAVSAGWDRAALPVLLSLVAAGGPGMDRVYDLAVRSDAIEIATACLGTAGSSQALTWLTGCDALPKEIVPMLEKQLLSLDASTEDLRRPLYRALARTGDPAVSTLLLEQLRANTDEDHFAMVVDALLSHSFECPDEALAGALVECAKISPTAPTVPGPTAQAGRRKRRSRSSAQLKGKIVARLAQMGSPKIVECIHAAGDNATRPRLMPEEEGRDWPNFGRLKGFDWLVRGYRDDASGAWVMWHGFDAAEYAELWRRLLAPREDGSYDTDAYQRACDSIRMTGSSTVRSLRLVKFVYSDDYSDVQPALVRVVVEAWQNRLASGGPAPTDAEGGYQSLGTVLLLARLGLVTDPKLRGSIEALTSTCLESSNPFARSVALRTLHDSPSPENVDRAVRALSDRNREIVLIALESLQRWKAPVPLEAAASVMRHADRDVRVLTPKWLVGMIEQDPMPLLRTALADEERIVRTAACVAIGKRLKLDGVEPLLAALGDRSEEVRAAAEESLRSIRFYYDQKAHWDRVFAGEAGVSRNGAAEALVAQTRADQSRAVRLLAIRSLGQLGVVEILPILIDLTKSDDAEIQAAASEAIGRIHAVGK